MYLRVFTLQAISRLLHAHLHVGLHLFCQILWLRLVFSSGLLGERCVTSKQGIALLKQTYKSLPVKDMFVCYYLCKEDAVCQSINFYKNRNLCELNNRTRSVRLSNVVPDSNAFYLDNPFRGKLKWKFQSAKVFKLVVPNRDSTSTFFPECFIFFFRKYFYPSSCIGLYLTVW